MVEIVTAGLGVHGQDLVWNLKNVYVSDDQSTLNPIIYTVLICSIIAFYIYIYIIYIIYICTYHFDIIRIMHTCISLDIYITYICIPVIDFPE